jgi:hypothetical protein
MQEQAIVLREAAPTDESLYGRSRRRSLFPYSGNREFLQRTSKSVSETGTCAGARACRYYLVVEPLPLVPEPEGGAEPDPLPLLLPDPLVPPPVVPDGVVVPGPELVPEPGAPMPDAAGLGGLAAPEPEASDPEAPEPDVPELVVPEPELPIPVPLVLLPGLVAVEPPDP